MIRVERQIERYRIGHTTSKIENYMDSPFLDWFQVLSLCAVNEMIMPGRRSVFENWADYCSVEMEKLFVWDSRSVHMAAMGYRQPSPWRVLLYLNSLQVIDFDVVTCYLFREESTDGFWDWWHIAYSYLRQGGYVFIGVSWFVCLFVSRFTQKQLNRFS